MAAFGDWGFDPVRLSNPFPHNESSVHICRVTKIRLCHFNFKDSFQENLVGLNIMKFVMVDI